MDAVEEKANELEYSLKGMEHLKFLNSPFADVPFYQTVLAPEDRIYIHPVLLAKILDSPYYNGIVDIVKTS